MIFRQLFDAESCTFTYIIGDRETGEAAIIDAVVEQADRDIKYLGELGLTLKYMIETHVHADHITAVSKLKKAFSSASSVYSKHANLKCADIEISDGDVLRIGKHELRFYCTPGHTDSCMSIVVGDKIFSGDAVLIRGCGRTDFQQGSAKKLFASIVTKIFSHPDEFYIYPAHNYIGLTVTTVGEEKKFNPNFADGTEDGFVNRMDALKLPYPKKIDASLPANLICGDV